MPSALDAIEATVHDADIVAWARLSTARVAVCIAELRAAAKMRCETCRAFCEDEDWTDPEVGICGLHGRGVEQQHYCADWEAQP